MKRRAITAFTTIALLAAACGDDGGGDDDADVADVADDGGSATTVGTVDESTALTLVTYDSFPEGDTSLNDALAAFTDDTGIDVELLIAGDTGTMLAKAALTAGNPEGDVMWGIDNTYLSRAIDEEIFDPYTVEGVEIDAALTELVPGGEATPVDYGDVCVNYDIGYFADNGLDVPTSLDDLLDPAYADLLVVENPATSSPGLAFLLATVDEYGADGWQEYWQALADNGVAVTDGWTEAYYEQFSWAGGGDRPLVVSYGSSPPAEVIFADPPREDAPTGVIESTCFRQVEFAGVLRGTEHPNESRLLLDHLVGEAVQAELPLTLFVYPANTAVDLPQEFVDFAAVPDDPRTVDPADIADNREAWIDEWTAIVVG